MDKVFIKDLHIRAILGVRDWERNILQDIMVNIVLFTETRPAARSDQLQDCVDYASLAHDVRVLVENARCYTVEALAEAIASLCLTRERVVRTLVRVEKPGAVTGTASVGAEIERPRE